MAFTQMFHHRVFHLDDSKSPLYSTFVPAVLVFMAMYIRGATTSVSYRPQHLYSTRGTRRVTLEEELLPPLTSISSKWIHNCSTVLVGMTATYLTLMVLIECTIRVLLLKAGIHLYGPVDENNRLADRKTKQLELALDRCIEGSLREVNLNDLLDDNDNDDCNDSDNFDESVIGPCCGIVDDPKPPIRCASFDAGSCAICLEEFKPGDTVVAGLKTCCKSNKFHKACIQKWLRINDSCPCCRSPMLEFANDKDNGDAPNNRITTTHARYIRSQFWIRFDTATRLRNEIMTYFIPQRPAIHHE